MHQQMSLNPTVNLLRHQLVTIISDAPMLINFNDAFFTHYLERRGGAAVKALASHCCGQGSIGLVSHVVEYVIGSFPCSEGFSPVLPIFLPPQNQHFQFQFNLETVDKKSHLVECPLLNPIPIYSNINYCKITK